MKYLACVILIFNQGLWSKRHITKKRAVNLLGDRCFRRTSHDDLFTNVNLLQEGFPEQNPLALFPAVVRVNQFFEKIIHKMALALI